MSSLIDIATREGEELKATLRVSLAGSRIQDAVGGIYPKIWVDVGSSSHTPLIEAHETWMVFCSRIESVLYGRLPNPVFLRKLELVKVLNEVINQSEGHNFATTTEAADFACKCVDDLVDIIKALPSAENTLIAVPDTNVLIDHPNLVEWAIKGTDRFRILLVPAVLREIDAHSKSEKERLSRPAQCIRNFTKELRRRNSNVVVKGRSSLILWSRDATGAVANGLDPTDADDRVLCGFLDVQRHHPHAAVFMLTHDLMMTAKAQARRISLAELEVNGE